MQRATLLERAADSLPSLSADTAFLKILKQNCSLPSADSFTEYDANLALFTDAAERWIDFITGTSYRPRNYTLTVQSINAVPRYDTYYRWNTIPWHMESIVLPVRPVTTPPTIAWTDSDGVTGSLVLGSDYSFAGGRSLTPTITMLPGCSLPSIGLVPWPYVITFSTAANNNLPEIQKLAIVQLASYYFRNPQAMGEETPNMGHGFWGLLGSLDGSFL